MITKYTLENGLTILLEPIDEVVSISAGLWVKTGSRNETKGQEGYAHFIEHMLFRGTERYSSRDIARLVDRVGGQHNAATNREYTCYYINVIADYLDLTIEILADMYYRSLFDKSEIDKEKNVIIEEIRMYEDTPDELVHDYFIESMFRDHPLGHPIIGTVESVKNVSRERILSFFNEWYADSESIFAIAGRFDVEEAKQIIDRCFSGRRPRPVPCASQPGGNGARIMRNHIDRDLEQVHFCLGVEGLDKYHEDRWALYTLSTIMGGSMSSRLFQNIREKEGLCYSIYSFHSSYTDRGVFGIYCGTSPKNYARALELIMQDTRDIVKNGITAEELADTKAYMKGNIALSLEATEVRMGQLARNEMSYGRHFTFEDIVAIIDSVTMDDFHRVCESVLNNNTMTLVSMGKLKKKEKIPLLISV